MNDILFNYLDDFCIAYLNNILIYSKDFLKYYKYVWKILQHLRDADLQVNIKKSKFWITRMKFLGFIVFTEGIEVDSDKITVIWDWQVLSTVQGVQGFLEFYNFYWCFIREYECIAKPLNALTHKGILYK
jgi:hypothetical protein